ncbi:unnamed protein product [Lepeophtheirus salmonis]|uniref:(salmon louse) hypothetical protein n=1 Tax=Lepeophtheirus salmonis TaxID=72036 RepID=A0A7R8CPS9_LEPSM|nr:unnamed protein product [Lepeophtheirus salmonis]CAF2889100.1 unnamed protein product [Lepeophtheirus salmonis]
MGHADPTIQKLYKTYIPSNNSSTTTPIIYNNYFYFIPDLLPPSMNPGQVQPPSPEYNDSHENCSTKTIHTSMPTDSIEGRTHEQNNNEEQLRNNASYWDQQSHYENGYYDPQFHP